MSRKILSFLTVVLFWPVLACADQLAVRGDFVQGGIVRGTLPLGTTLELDGQAVKVSPDGAFVIGFGRDQDGPVVLTLTDAQGRKTRLDKQLKKRNYEIQRIEGVEKKYVSPPQETQQRIRDDARQVKQARQVVLDQTDFMRDFIWPARGVISGVYGSQRFFNGKARRPHFGLDIAAPTGTPVYAPAGGKVTLVQKLYFSGWTVILDHGHGLSSSFLHMDAATVEVGQYLEQGALLGKIGATGRVTGPHLDWRMNWRDQRVDPRVLVSGKPQPLNS